MISFFVPGLAQPAGSKRAFAIKCKGMYTGRTAVVDANPKAKDWKGTVRQYGQQAWGQAMISGPIRLHLIFYMPRPKNHFRSNGQLKDWAPQWHTSRPDVLKLTRAVEDALTGVIWKDDSQIVDEHIEKPYVGTGTHPFDINRPIGVQIEITSL